VREMLSTAFERGHSGKFEQALSFTRTEGIDGFKSSVRVGTFADRKTEAGLNAVQRLHTNIFRLTPMRAREIVILPTHTLSTPG
jgi:hypothetical protein